MTPDETLAQATQHFDIINKAAHYNKHSSGVECIELAKRLGFNLGNAFKYVFRRGDKGNEVQDLGKAIYYLKCEADQLQSLIRWRTAQEVADMRCNDHFTLTDIQNIQAVCGAEPNRLASAIFNRIFARNTQVLAYIDGLLYAVDFAERLIREAEDGPEPEPEANPNSITTHPDWVR